MTQQDPVAIALPLIKEHEGFSAVPYLDPVQVWTVGYGHAISVGGKHLRGPADRPAAYSLYPKPLTKAQAEALLLDDVTRRYARPVLDALRKDGIQVSAHAQAALISFAYNLGVDRLIGSTLYDYMQAGNLKAAASEFHKWNKGGGKVLPGLIRRRRDEAALFNVRDA